MSINQDVHLIRKLLTITNSVIVEIYEEGGKVNFFSSNMVPYPREIDKRVYNDFKLCIGTIASKINGTPKGVCLSESEKVQLTPTLCNEI